VVSSTSVTVADDYVCIVYVVVFNIKASPFRYAIFSTGATNSFLSAKKTKLTAIIIITTFWVAKSCTAVCFIYFLCRFFEHRYFTGWCGDSTVLTVTAFVNGWGQYFRVGDSTQRLETRVRLESLFLRLATYLRLASRYVSHESS